MRYRIFIEIFDDEAVAMIVNEETGNRRVIVPAHPRSAYEDGPKWSGRDEWLGDFWARVRDTYDTV